MSKKFEVASPEWLQALKALLIEHASRCPELSTTISETYLNVPAHLDRDGTRTISWHAIIRNGNVDFRDGALEDAALKASADCALVRTQTRKLWGDDPVAREAHEKALEEAIRAGRLKREGDWNSLPAEIQKIHDLMGEITA